VAGSLSPLVSKKTLVTMGAFELLKKWVCLVCRYNPKFGWATVLLFYIKKKYYALDNILVSHKHCVPDEPDGSEPMCSPLEPSS